MLNICLRYLSYHIPNFNMENSIDIIKPKIEFIKSNNIDLVLTYNVGCSLNFINSINLKNINKVQVMHPITFLNSNLV